MKGISSRTLFVFAVVAAAVVFLGFFFVLNTTHQDRQIVPGKQVLNDRVVKSKLSPSVITSQLAKQKYDEKLKGGQKGSSNFLNNRPKSQTIRSSLIGSSAFTDDEADYGEDDIIENISPRSSISATKPEGISQKVSDLVSKFSNVISSAIAGNTQPQVVEDTSVIKPSSISLPTSSLSDQPIPVSGTYKSSLLNLPDHDDAGGEDDNEDIIDPISDAKASSIEPSILSAPKISVSHAIDQPEFTVPVPELLDDADDYYGSLEEEIDEYYGINAENNSFLESTPVSKVISIGDIGSASLRGAYTPPTAQPVPILRRNISESVCMNTTFATHCDIYPYVRFWRRKFTRPQDCFSSPLRVRGFDFKKNPEKFKYLVFHPDEGGWNNIRMAAETALVFGIVTGRVIVLPPKEKFYLLNLNTEGDNDSTFDKFFDLSKIAEVADMISMEDFLTYVAGNGLLNLPLPTKDIKTFVKPGNGLWPYMEKACYTKDWATRSRFIGFNFTTLDGFSVVPKKLSKGNEDAKLYDYNRGEVLLGNVREDYTPGTRLKLFASHDRRVMSYNESFHSQRAVFFPGDYRDSHRLLTHFYAYLYFADQRMDRLYKRMVRDRLHYHDLIFCLAGQVVKMLHEMSAEMHNADHPSDFHHLTGGGNTGQGATYHAYHVRRGDFQYDFAKISAPKIWENTRDVLDPKRSTLLYISTDEKDHSFFNVFKNSTDSQGVVTYYRLVFLDDFIKQIKLAPGQTLNRNHIGMIEQVVCANAHTFIGTPLSTFTGYITRMRGYYRDGRYSRTYYTLKDYKHQLHQQQELKGPFWAREFAVAHKDVDDDPNP